MMDRDIIYVEAIQRCHTLLNRAEELKLKDPLAMSLATVDRNARPSVRMVLLRGCDERGFVFYTNSLSKKGQDLSENPSAAICLYWEELREQLRAEGDVEIISNEETDAYWSRGNRLSQLAACASRQSEVLNDRQEYEQLVDELDRKYAGNSVLRPSHWFGYRLVPRRIEVWIGREGRMHERTSYEQTHDGWKMEMLFP